MKIDREQKRLKAIKEIYPFIFTRRCRSCSSEYVREHMYKVTRNSHSNRVFEAYYCKQCTPTKQDVINSIDSEHWGSIAFIDN